MMIFCGDYYSPCRLWTDLLCGLSYWPWPLARHCPLLVRSSRPWRSQCAGTRSPARTCGAIKPQIRFQHRIIHGTYLRATMISSLGPWCHVPIPIVGIWAPLFNVTVSISSTSLRQSTERGTVDSASIYTFFKVVLISPAIQILCL